LIGSDAVEVAHASSSPLARSPCRGQIVATIVFRVGRPAAKRTGQAVLKATPSRTTAAVIRLPAGRERPV
jgi:hypothetical protein